LKGKYSHVTSRKVIGQLIHNRLIQSKPFTFYIGPEATPIVVHTAAVAATSTSLDAIVNGNTEEARAGMVTWKDVQVDEFVRYCEWAYRGDYTVSLRKKTKDTKDTEDPKVPKVPKYAECPERSCPGENFPRLLFAHARLYAFANDHLIEPLKKLVAKKGGDILFHLQPCRCRIRTVLQLAQYVYSAESNLPKRESEKLDYMRVKVMMCIIAFTGIGKHETFLPFLKQNREQAEDYCLLQVVIEVRYQK
jgi:hypothetical protein